MPYLHIGTDEVKFVDHSFVPEMVAYVRSKGKKVISWNPGWHYKQGEIDMTQLWSYRGKAQPGIPAIDCRFHYANHYDNYADLVALFNSSIYNQPTGSDDLAGCILAFWSNYGVLFSTSLMTHDVEYFLVCILAIHILSFIRCLFKSFACILIYVTKFLGRNKKSTSFSFRPILFILF